LDIAGKVDAELKRKNIVGGGLDGSFEWCKIRLPLTSSAKLIEAQVVEVAREI